MRLKLHAAELATRGRCQAFKNVREVKTQQSRGLKKSYAPMSRLLRPSAPRLAMCSSCGVSWSIGDSRTPTGETPRRAQLGLRSLHPRVRAQLGETTQGGNIRLPSGLGLEALLAQPLPVLEPGLRQVETMGVLTGNGKGRLETRSMRKRLRSKEEPGHDSERRREPTVAPAVQSIAPSPPRRDSQSRGDRFEWRRRQSPAAVLAA